MDSRRSVINLSTLKLMSVEPIGWPSTQDNGSSSIWPTFDSAVFKILTSVVPPPASHTRKTSPFSYCCFEAYTAAASASVNDISTACLCSLPKPAFLISCSVSAIIAGSFQVVGTLKTNSTFLVRHLGMVSVKCCVIDLYTQERKSVNHLRASSRLGAL